jgi:hypothetical protein
MTDADLWDRCLTPQPMLAYLEARCDSGDRKLRLFAVACCRRILTFLTDERSRAAVEVGERRADRLASDLEVEAARLAAREAAARRQAARGSRLGQRAWRTQLVADQAAWAACHALESSRYAVGAVARATEVVAELRGLGFDGHPGHWQCHLLREIFGNPFRPAAVERDWLRWNGGCVARLAQGIYAEHRFGDLPILADALEEAGCASPDVLSHCRSAGLHVRGCWLLDWAIGKEPA